MDGGTPKTRVILVDNAKFHVFVGADKEADALVARSLAGGKSVREKGVTAWVQEDVVFDKAKSGSAAYQWKGDKVRVSRTLVKRTKEGETRESVGFAWRNWE